MKRSSFDEDRSARMLTGHVAEYGELLDLLAERPGFLVLDADPWSGASALLATAAESVEHTFVTCDARVCADTRDLAMGIADAAIARLAPDAESWWLGSASSAGAAALRVARLLRSKGIDSDAFRKDAGPDPRLLSDAIELVVALDSTAGLIVDHLGLMLSAMPVGDARELLGELRSVRQRHPQLDLVLVEHSDGLMGSALADPAHPMFRGGDVMRIYRSLPERFANDLAVTRAWTDVSRELLLTAAQLAEGVPALTWWIVDSAEEDGAHAGWQRIRHATEAGTARRWDLLRRVHPQAQPVVGAMAAGFPPHSVLANAKSINDALNRLRGLGVVWQPEDRRWSLGDPLLASWARENRSSWVVRRRHAGR